MDRSPGPVQQRDRGSPVSPMLRPSSTGENGHLTMEEQSQKRQVSIPSSPPPPTSSCSPVSSSSPRSGSSGGSSCVSPDRCCQPAFTTSSSSSRVRVDDAQVPGLGEKVTGGGMKLQCFTPVRRHHQHAGPGGKFSGLHHSHNKERGSVGVSATPVVATSSSTVGLEAVSSTGNSTSTAASPSSLTASAPLPSGAASADPRLQAGYPSLHTRPPRFLQRVAELPYRHSHPHSHRQQARPTGGTQPGHRDRRFIGERARSRSPVQSDDRSPSPTTSPPSPRPRSRDPDRPGSAGSSPPSPLLPAGVHAPHPYQLPAADPFLRRGMTGMLPSSPAGRYNAHPHTPPRCQAHSNGDAPLSTPPTATGRAPASSPSPPVKEEEMRHVGGAERGSPPPVPPPAPPRPRLTAFSVDDILDPGKFAPTTSPPVSSPHRSSQRPHGVWSPWSRTALEACGPRHPGEGADRLGGALEERTPPPTTLGGSSAPGESISAL